MVRVLEEDPEAIYFKATSLAHRDEVRDQKCPTCLSPCQMNVAAIKQVVPYVRFLARAGTQKARHAMGWQAETPAPVAR